jgi:glutamate-5-semialdehyde dehydrogenase
MFSDPRLGLAVARGSGAAVSQLGAVARQAGIPVSLHGTGGAWIVVSENADPAAVEEAVYNSLDRKVCNTVNTLAIVDAGADKTLPAALTGIKRAADRRGANPKLHFVGRVDLPEFWAQEAPISRAGGQVVEPLAEPISGDRLGEEWEWEDSPELTLVMVDSIDEAVGAFNKQSPRFVVSLISSDTEEHEAFYAAVDAPFVGDGFTRWVDGQYALDRPELGLSNWQFGRLFGRGGILSGDGIFTVRTRVTQDRPDIGR